MDEEVPSGRLAAGQWTRILRKYRTANSLRATWELAITSLAFVLSWIVLLLAVESGQRWLYLLVLVPAAGFLVRLFVIQHDCGHGSFFPNRRANDWVGRTIGVVTLTPYDQWRRTHAVHHASSGNLDRRGIGDVLTLTVDEYLARPRWGRLLYRLYRHPAVMFGIGPLYVFLLQNRVPSNSTGKGWRSWFSVIATDASICGVASGMIWAVGVKAFCLIFLPLILLGSGAGVWLFYVQHQFENTYWANGENWSAQRAALDGSSHYDLPKVLRWFTANIGLHHVHHLSSRIPSYRLPEVLCDHAELRNLGRITLVASLRGLRLALWDEKIHRLVSFKQSRREYAGRRAPQRAS